MRVKLKTQTSKKAYVTHLTLSKAGNARERKVLRALKLCIVTSHVVCALPTSQGKTGKLLFSVDFDIPKEVFEKHYRAKPQLNFLAAPEVRNAFAEQRAKEEQASIDRSILQSATAKSLGLFKLVPKDLRPKFECMCGQSFKRELKLKAHQRKCAVILDRDTQDLFDTAHAIKQRLKEKPKKAVKHASKAVAGKVKGKAVKSKQVSSKVPARKSKGKRDAAKPSRGNPSGNSVESQFGWVKLDWSYGSKKARRK